MFYAGKKFFPLAFKPTIASQTDLHLKPRFVAYRDHHVIMAHLNTQFYYLDIEIKFGMSISFSAA
jgi:hypothetical protein